VIPSEKWGPKWGATKNPANQTTTVVDGVTFSVKGGNKQSGSTKNACYLFLVIPIG